MELEEYRTTRFTINHDGKADHIDVGRYFVVYNNEIILQKGDAKFEIIELGRGLDNCKCHCAWKLTCSDKKSKFDIIGSHDEIIQIYHKIR
jgi:hypothetical protein